MLRFLLKKYQDHVHCSFGYKPACVDDEFTKPIVVFRGENAASKFIEAILKECQYCKKVMKKHFKRNMIMIEEELFQSRNNFCICEKLVDDDNEKVRDHCHVTGKIIGAAHWICNKSSVN